MTATPGPWSDGELPANVVVGARTIIHGTHAFKRFRTKEAEALRIGADCTLDGAHFAVEQGARITVGDCCYFTHAILLCEERIEIGSCVLMGWNVTVTDSDFHPIAPALRVRDAIACSTLNDGTPRPKVATRPVVIEDDVWIGPNATILKGVRIGQGAFIEPGALVAHDVPAGARVFGNPAQVRRP
jgi:acetyltransferase-like isoleucine patch superfamily enzyme